MCQEDQAYGTSSHDRPFLQAIYVETRGLFDQLYDWEEFWHELQEPARSISMRGRHPPGPDNH